MSIPEIKVVLVKSLYESNIGATSRAMANMGASDLILIAPQCEIGMGAQKAAATAQEPLQNRTVYANWDEFFKAEPEGIRIALTARAGKGRAARDLQETLRFIKTETDSQETPSPIYFIMGPEDWGLSAEDIELVHYSCTLPTYGVNSSLNLAQASLLTMFVYRDIFGGERTRPLKRQSPQKSDIQENHFINDTLKTWINEMGFQTEDHGHNVHTVLRRVLLQNMPTKHEINILHTIFQQDIRKLREYNEYLKRHGPLGKLDNN